MIVTSLKFLEIVFQKSTAETYFVSENMHLLDPRFDCQFVVVHSNFGHITIPDNMKILLKW